MKEVRLCVVKFAEDDCFREEGRPRPNVHQRTASEEGEAQPAHYDHRNRKWSQEANRLHPLYAYLAESLALAGG